MTDLVRYDIDYGSGRGRIWTTTAAEQAAAQFGRLGATCFGLRKSMTREPRVICAVGVDGFPDWCPSSTTVALEHNSCVVDRIAWNADGVKVRNEHGDDESKEVECPACAGSDRRCGFCYGLGKVQPEEAPDGN